MAIKTFNKQQKSTAYTLFFMDGSAEVRYMNPIQFAGFKRSAEYKKIMTCKKTAEVIVITKIKMW